MDTKLDTNLDTLIRRTVKEVVREALKEGIDEVLNELADREGFEPSKPVKTCTLSRGVVSATHPSVLIFRG